MDTGAVHMSAEVGGQLEAVPPRRSLFGPDYRRLAVLLFTAAAVHAWLVAHTVVPARDSLSYARIAVNLADPNAGAEPGHPRHRIDVIREAVYPPGYPVAIWATDKVLARVSDLPPPERVLLAAQLANAVAAVLLVVPLYLTGRILFGRNVAFAAALLFQVLPVPTRVTSDGLSEGLYLLVLGVAILLGVRSARRPTVGGFLMCGLATGVSYLVRPEGLLAAGAVGVVIVAAGLSRRWPRDLALGRLAALGVGVALVAIPYMMLIGKITNKTSPDLLLHWGEEGAAYRGGFTAARPPATRGPLFAEWAPARDDGRNRPLWALTAVAKEMIKSLHYVVGLLAVVALVARRRQLFAPDPGLWVVVALGTLNLLLLVYLAARVGYVSERHTVPLVMLCCVLGAAAAEPLTRAISEVPRLGRIIVWPEAAPATLVAAIVVSALPYTFKSLHSQREGHKHAGRWLAANMGGQDFLKDPLSWAEWYAGRTFYIPPRYHGRPERVWVVWEYGRSTPHSRLPSRRDWSPAARRSSAGRRTRRRASSPSRCTGSPSPRRSGCGPRTGGEA
jgi:hypothetical protein